MSVPRWLDRVLLALKYALMAVAFKIFFLMPTGQALSFLRTPYYAISDIKMFDLFAGFGVVGWGVIGGLALLSVLVRSFWCRYLCPYGALLGVLGLLAPVQLERDAGSCVHCHECNRVCPNGVEVERAKRWVLSAECMGCTRCSEVCPVAGTLRFRLLGLQTLRPAVLGLLFLAVFFGAVTWATADGRWQSSLAPQQIQRLDAVLRGGERGR